MYHVSRAYVKSWSTIKSSRYPFHYLYRMFKFAFDIETDDADEQINAMQTQQASPEDSVPKLPSETVTLKDLLKTLPDHISCSPILAPGATTLLRRDLYDARFQVMTESDAETSEKQEYVDASSDLIPGLYEGGLKTWEGGVDLIKVLSDMVGNEDKVGAWAVGGRILEVGCGTGLPSSFLLRQILQHSTTKGDSRPSTIHLQDYNRSVLSLVTLPNLILAALAFLPYASIEYEHADDSASTTFTEAGTLSLTPELLLAFEDLLKKHQITLEFTSGDWSHFAQTIEQPYDLVLTAETIYAENSVSALLDVLQRASRGGWENAMERLKLDGVQSVTGGSSVVLVAAKVIYFGVGGGIDGFIQSLEERRGRHVTVLDVPKGVKRTVLRVGW